MKLRTFILMLGSILISFFAAPQAGAALKSKTVDYVYGGKTFQGYLAWDDAVTGKRPGVLVVHEWWGLNDYARSRAALEQGKVAARIVVYPEAMHGFTVPGAERHGLKGVAYEAEADRKSWAELLSILGKLFQGESSPP